MKSLFGLLLLSLLLASFLPSSIQAFAPRPLLPPTTRTTTTIPLYGAARIQFVRGVDEPVVPVVKLTRAKDGSTGVARFNFIAPNVFDQSIQGDVTGMFLLDDEGELSTTDVNARFSNGKPQAIECTYVMKSPEEWDRFMRFMERYGEENGLGLRKA
jgi:photosystem II 13kDa protein